MINMYLDGTLVSINHLVESAFIITVGLETHVHEDPSQFLVK